MLLELGKVHGHKILAIGYANYHLIDVKIVLGRNCLLDCSSLVSIVGKCPCCPYVESTPALIEAQ